MVVAPSIEPALTVGELARMWRVHPRTIMREIRRGPRGRLFGAFRVGRNWRVPESVAQRFMEAGRYA